MSIRRSTSSRTRTATVLVAIAAAGLTGVGAATAADSGDESVVDDAPSDARTQDGGWPAELTEHTRLYVNPYRSYLVQEIDGVPTLVASTGWDSCYFLTQDGEQRYPC